MIASHQLRSVDEVRARLSVLVLPLQLIIDKPIKLFQWVGTSISTQQEVLGENAQLRARQLLLQAKLQRLLALERENAQLRELLSSSSQLSGQVLVSQLLSVDADPLSQEIVLDKGENEGVSIGQPVLDAFGVMGQVINVTRYNSHVLLITDTRSAIPVQNNRNGIRSILVGTGYTDELNLLHVPVTADVSVGDLLVTSGMGGRFPFGYPVGTIISVKKLPTDRFANITVRPSAHIDRTRQVILLWPPPEEQKTPTASTVSDQPSATKTKTNATPVPPAQKSKKQN